MDGQFSPHQRVQFSDNAVGVLTDRYYANAVNFDGSNDYLSRGANLTGAADSKQITGVWWHNGGDNTNDTILNWSLTASFARFLLIRRGGGAGHVIRCRASNAAASAFALDVDGDQAVNAAAGWVCIMWSFDLSDTGKRHIYTNDTANSLSVTSYANESIPFSSADDFLVGYNGAYWTGDCGGCQLWTGVYLDLSTEANRRLFIDANGKPVSPGIARAALGTPIVELAGPTSDWHTNRGSGGGFTETGALTDAASSPSA